MNKKTNTPSKKISSTTTFLGLLTVVSILGAFAFSFGWLLLFAMLPFLGACISATMDLFENDPSATPKQTKTVSKSVSITNKIIAFILGLILVFVIFVLLMAVSKLLT